MIQTQVHNNNARLEKYCISKTEFVYEEYLKDDLIWIYQEKSLYQNIHFSFFLFLLDR